MGEQEEAATPSVEKRKKKVKRVNKRRGAARLYALALRIDQLQSDLATGAHLQRLGVPPPSNPASDTSTSPSSPTTFPTPTPTPIKNKKPRPRRRKKAPPDLCHLHDPSKRKKLRRFGRNRRRRLRRLISRLQRRIEQVRGTVHHQCARELTERYDHILIPSFSTSQMVQKGGAGRRINKVTVRQMLGWAHYRFRQRLLQQAEPRGATVHVVSEAYTSKSCGRCGRLPDSLGGSHTFRCPHPPCDYRSDRDAHGARNIMAMNVERYVGNVVPVQHAGTGGRQQRQLQRGARAAAALAAAAPAAAARDGKEEAGASTQRAAASSSSGAGRGG